MLKKLHNWFESEHMFIFWLFVLNLSSQKTARNLVYFVLGRSDLWGILRPVANDTALIFFCVIFLDLVLYLLLHKFSRLHKLIKNSILAFNALIFIIDLFTLYYYQVSFNRLMLETIITSNLNEITEFVPFYMSDTKLYLYYILVFIAVYLFYRIFRVLCRYKNLVIALFVMMCFAGTMCAARQYFYNWAEGKPRMIGNIAVSRVVNMCMNIHHDNLAYNKMLSDIPEKVILTQNNSTIPYGVFVIGEATGRNHMGIYGYNLNTTPNLLSRQKNDNLYVFTDTISPHGVTFAVLPKILTFYRYGMPGNYYNYVDLPRILNAAGYFTAWISNQERGALGGMSIKSFYYRNCDYWKFTETFNDNSWTIGVNPDEVLLPLLDDVMKMKHDKNFYFIHLMGTHAGYSKRYSVNWRKGGGGLQS